MVLGSGIRKKPIQDPGSRGQKGTGSRIRIRNTGPLIVLILFSITFKIIFIKHYYALGF